MKSNKPLLSSFLFSKEDREIAAKHKIVKFHLFLLSGKWTNSTLFFGKISLRLEQMT